MTDSKALVIALVIFILTPTLDAAWSLDKKATKPKKEEYYDRLDGMGHHYVWSEKDKKWIMDTLPEKKTK